MSHKTTFFTNEYGERVIIRRVFLNRTCSAEALVLFTQLLNDFPQYSLKKPLSKLAGATLRFTSYYYHDGYVLEGRLSQSQASSLKYLFSNPYKEGEKILNDVFSLGFIHSEKNIAVCKERILAENYIRLRSSLTVGKMMISSSYAPICFDEKKLKSVTPDDLSHISSQVSSLNKGDLFYFGASEPEPLSLCSDYQDGLDLKESPLATNVVMKDYLDDESIMFVFEHAMIENRDEKLIQETVFAGLITYLKKYLAKKVYIDYQMDFTLLDSTHTLFSITTLKGRLDSIVNHISLKVGENLPFDLTPCYDAAICDNKMKEISLKMSFSKLIHEEMIAKDLSLQDKGVDLSRNSYRDFINTLLIDDLLFARKEKHHA